ncbi:hypothetical protein C7271_04595 [filamentous cyanobacterium CCP5]|nr:hypothetical protein C7271_04595 [filamentous cyanobacterium CCP5]
MLDIRPLVKTTRRAPGTDFKHHLQGCLRHRLAPYWLIGSVSLGGTLINAPLVLSAGTGLVVHQQLSQLSPQQWQALASRLQRRWRGPGSRTRVWLLSAAAVMLTYGTTALWSETHGIWLSLILGGQTLLAIALVSLLLRPQPAVRSTPATPKLAATPFEAALNQLVHSDPLTRLMGVRQIIRQALPQGDREYLPGQTIRAHLTDCLHLMLAQEQEPMVRTAIREGLELLRKKPQLTAGAPTLQTPLRRAQPGSEPVRARRVVEYVEP